MSVTGGYDVVSGPAPRGPEIRFSEPLRYLQERLGELPQEFMDLRASGLPSGGAFVEEPVVDALVTLSLSGGAVLVWRYVAVTMRVIWSRD